MAGMHFGRASTLSSWATNPMNRSSASVLTGPLKRWRLSYGVDDDFPATLADDMVEASALPPAALLDELAGRGLNSVWIDGDQTLQAVLAQDLVDATS
jgi:riboflavin biosynthesis pyrimidine reductase